MRTFIERLDRDLERVWHEVAFAGTDGDIVAAASPQQVEQRLARVERDAGEQPDAPVVSDQAAKGFSSGVIPRRAVIDEQQLEIRMTLRLQGLDVLVRRGRSAVAVPYDRNEMSSRGGGRCHHAAETS